MKAFVIVNAEFEETAATEILELTGAKAEVEGHALLFEAGQEQIIRYSVHCLAPKRVVVLLEKCPDVLQIHFKDVNWNDYLTSSNSFKVEVEGVKGNPNRLEIAKTIAAAMFIQLRAQSLEPVIELKKPDLLCIVYFTGKNYYVGIDLLGKEINTREYRLFTNSNSFKGDYAYHILRTSKFAAGEKILLGMVKDGTLAVETALFGYNLIVQSKNKNQYSWNRIPLFSGVVADSGKSDIPNPPSEKMIYAFDSNFQNVTAAKKNAIVAGVKEYLEISKYAIDDVDVKFSPGYFDRIIFQITTKDEDQLNEIYYQSSYVLKQKGTLLLVTREKFEVSVPSTFTLIKEELITRGQSSHKLWLMEKR